MSLSEEKIKAQVERLRTYAAHNPSAIITEVADALAAVREEQAKQEELTGEPVAETLAGVTNTGYVYIKALSRSIPAGTNLYTHAPDSAAEIARLREANAELLEGLDACRGNINPERGYADELEAEINELIAKHGGK